VSDWIVDAWRGRARPGGAWHGKAGNVLTVYLKSDSLRESEVVD